MTTASALITQASVRFKDPSFRVITASQWANLLNQAYNHANRRTPLWPWNESAEQTINFTAGTRSAALPTDVLQVNWAYDTTDDYRLVPQEGRGDQWHQDHLRSETGQPVTYRLRGGYMELFPTPSADTTVVAECISRPSALAASTVTNYFAAGAAAGDITVTGVAVGDTLVSVLGVKDSDQSTHDFTSEFTITAANTINNVGGTSTSGYHLAVTTYAANTAASPVWPSQFHDILIEGMLALAYADTGSTEMATLHQSQFEAQIDRMLAELLFARTETNAPIRDTFWS